MKAKSKISFEMHLAMLLAGVLAAATFIGMSFHCFVSPLLFPFVESLTGWALQGLAIPFTFLLSLSGGYWAERKIEGLWDDYNVTSPYSVEDSTLIAVEGIKGCFAQPSANALELFSEPSETFLPQQGSKRKATNNQVSGHSARPLNSPAADESASGVDPLYSPSIGKANHGKR